MPGSLPDDGDFERYYNESKVSPNGNGTTEAEAYKKKVKEELEDEEEEGEEFPDRDQEEEGEGDDFGDQLDFSSVPVSRRFFTASRARFSC
jgi:hypothetical protein